MRPASSLLVAVLLASTDFAADPPAPPRPNVLVILADDMGFSDIGCYGGEIETPNIDRLAAGGIRFTSFYNTARCWPTRSCLLSGYYAQQIRMDPPEGRLPAWASLLPHRLKPLGYRSYHAGKWHVNGARWPVADGGFDRSYLFEDWDRYFTPSRHFEDDKKAPPAGPGSGYYATTAFADHAIGYLKEHAERHRGQPFFLYLAFIAPHFPLHALQADIAKYRDRYLEGWDAVRERRWKRLREMGIVDCALPPLDGKLVPRYLKPEFLEKLGPGEVDRAIPWKDLTDAQRRFQATKMAIHAAMVDRMDREIGRVLDQVRAMGDLDDTAVFFLSDNGADATILVRGDGHDPAAAPGSRASFLCLGPGWASASNAPFRRHKIWVHEGGISTPLVVSWPKGIAARGELRRAPGHLIDLAPTILELAGAGAPAVGTRRGLPAAGAPGPGGPPLPGRSLAPAFARDVPLEREFLFFHHEGNRALRAGDWKIVSDREDGGAWELYDLAKDRSEMVDLAEKQPEVLARLAARWKELEDEFRRQAGPASPETKAGKR